MARELAWPAVNARWRKAPTQQATEAIASVTTAIRVLIGTLRSVSKNPDLIVMIGGSSAEELRSRSRELGEVVCMSNAQEAVAFLEQHLEPSPKEVGR